MYYYLVWYFIKKGKVPLRCITNKIGYVYIVVLIEGFLYIWSIVDKPFKKFEHAHVVWNFMKTMGYTAVV